MGAMEVAGAAVARSSGAGTEESEGDWSCSASRAANAGIISRFQEGQLVRKFSVLSKL